MPSNILHTESTHNTQLRRLILKSDSLQITFTQSRDVTDSELRIRRTPALFQNPKSDGYLKSDCGGFENFVLVSVTLTQNLTFCPPNLSSSSLFPTAHKAVNLVNFPQTLRDNMFTNFQYMITRWTHGHTHRQTHGQTHKRTHGLPEKRMPSVANCHQRHKNEFRSASLTHK